LKILWRKIVVSVESVRAWFPKDLEELLIFEEITVPDLGDFIAIRPRHYLPSEKFAKIASIVRDNGGEYLSLGKASHFRAKKEGVSTVTSDQKALLIKDIFAYADNIEMVAREVEKQAGIIKEKLKELQQK